MIKNKIKSIVKSIAKHILKQELKELNDKLEFKENLIQEKLKIISKLKYPKDIELLTKYPSKLITYLGRTFPNSKTKCKVPVNVLVTPTDPFIIKDLKDWNLYQTFEDRETLVPKIYKKIKEKYYKYSSDEIIWGNNEIWEFPFEMREKGFKRGFDCDSWSAFQVSYYRAAGIEPQYVWVVAGMCKLGGHSTVEVYSDKDKKFHHLNSTYGRMYKTVSEFPTHKDAEDGLDRLGITNVWLSFNDKVARSLFDEKKIKNLLISNKIKSGGKK